jgi:hypothetical protein
MQAIRIHPSHLLIECRAAPLGWYEPVRLVDVAASLSACAVQFASLSRLTSNLNGLQAKRKDTELGLVLDYGIDEFGSDNLCPRSETIDQGGITKDIDRAWNPAAGVGNDPASVIAEQL